MSNKQAEGKCPLPRTPDRTGARFSLGFPQHQQGGNWIALRFMAMKERLKPPLSLSAGFFVICLKRVFLTMSHTMQMIVDGYVKLSARKELEDLRVHRHRLARELRPLNGRPFDLNSSIKQIEDEITVIEAGLARLDSAAAA